MSNPLLQRCFNRKKIPRKNSSWKFWRQTLQTQVQQISQMPTEKAVRGSVTFKEKVGCFFFLSVLKLKYLKYGSGQTDKTEPQHLM